MYFPDPGVVICALAGLPAVSFAGSTKNLQPLYLHLSFPGFMTVTGSMWAAFGDSSESAVGLEFNWLTFAWGQPCGVCGHVAYVAYDAKPAALAIS